MEAAETFYARTFALLPERPTYAKEADRLLNEVENRVGGPLPASIREWYSLEDAFALLQRYSNSDHAEPLESLGAAFGLSGGGTRDLAREGLLLVRCENQGVCCWAVRLDGSDDPPVVVSYDDDLETWQRCADRFSEYIFASVWDWGLVMVREPLIQAQNKPLSSEALGELQRRFDQEVTTYGWPTHTQYRFQKSGLYLLVWADDSQADWWLTADTPGHLAEAARDLWQLDQVGAAFWSNDRTGEAILDQLRAGAG